MQLSIIIVNYNVRVFLENALVSVFKALKGFNGEVIVVDNASEDGSVEMIRQKFSDVKLIVNEKNVGFAAANNRALGVCRGQYVLLLNPDTIVQEDTFRVMIDFLDQHPDVGLSGCKILNPDGTLQLACRRSFPTPWIAFTKIVGLSNIFPRSSIFGKYNLTYLDPNKTYQVDAVSGSFMFTRRSVIDAIGGLDEQFFMYGEDIDWCYRIQQNGWKIYYVYETQIIHFKGESARRSDIDEVKLFYEAMRVFVRKHLRRGVLSDITLNVGIAIREWIAFVGKIARPLRTACVDFVLINISLFLGEFFWFGEFFHFPAYAYPVTMTVPSIILIGAMYSSGVYTTRRLSFTRTAGNVIVGYIILSALTFFFKQYGFSRMVVVISGMINLIFLPGWRFIAKMMLHSPEHRRRSLFGRRTIIVGVGSSGQEVLRKLRARVDDGYDIVGFIDTNRKRVGEKVVGIEILGSIDNIGKVVEDQKVSEVIFSTDILSYKDILSVIERSKNRAVNYRLVPRSLDVIIGKTHIDELDDIPLVSIEYNINRPVNRVLKRLFDIIYSIGLILTLYPILLMMNKSERVTHEMSKKFLLLPKVLRGEMSIVGPPELSLRDLRNGTVASMMYLGKPGLTGLLQLNYHDELSPDEIEKYNLYYAKNQSMLLDFEIVIKTLLEIIKR
ncbi:MAG TPA: glycosyltransferase [Bacteroidota bacterium]|nr:glycosyltransferase [Bacteroidota bacterium]